MFSLAPLLYTEATIAPQEKCYVKLSVYNEHGIDR